MQPQTLDQLFEDAKNRAKNAPDDLPARSALWQIFAARGELDRARKQLELIPKLDATWMVEVQACTRLLDAEVEREAILAGKGTPSCIGEPPQWLAQQVAALQLLGEGRREAAVPLLTEVWNSGEPRAGSVNGEPFEWVRDGDARLGPCLEIIVQGRYYWAPWERVIHLEMKPPSEIRDRLWQPAMVQVTDDGPIEAFLPVRYPQPRNDDESMSRRTDWVQLGEELYIGYGQKCIVTDQDPVGFLDIRDFAMERPPARMAGQ
jgi:type VI secretion system protein ImpE